MAHRGLHQRIGLNRASILSRRACVTSVDRHLCQCTLELVKPGNRLQRLFQSLQIGHATPSSSGRTSAASPPPFTAAEFSELSLLISLLPNRFAKAIVDHPNVASLVEIVLDLGRPPLARFGAADVRLAEEPITRADLRNAVDKVSGFGDDNRAGINGTLHRISCIRNRDREIVGLTCRVGRAVQGCACLAADYAKAGKSLLILGRPGVGKTTAIRELSRYLAEEVDKRVVIVDTSNEIGGDGDVPHDAVGSSRRLQVARTDEQHEVMIEAVENHMPEVIVIDEIGTKKEALAARTISQRGVQLIATAHGHGLENILLNPSMVDLVGGVQSVIVGDEEMRRRGTRVKSIRERAAPPSFDVAIELLERDQWRIYPDIGAAVDLLLRGKEPQSETRSLQTESGVLKCIVSAPVNIDGEGRRPSLPGRDSALRVLQVGLDPDRIVFAQRLLGLQAQRMKLVFSLEAADAVLALKSQMRPKSLAREAAKAAGVPVYAVKSGSDRSILRALQVLLDIPTTSESDDEEEQQSKNNVVSLTVARNEKDALAEVRSAIDNIVNTTSRPVELLPRSPRVVQAQVELLRSHYPEHPFDIVGCGMQTRLRILPSQEWLINAQMARAAREPQMDIEAF